MIPSYWLRLLAACSRSVLSPEDALFPRDARVFEGFDLLREYFAFPRKFLGFKLVGLDQIVSQLRAKTVDVLFAFDEVNAAAFGSRAAADVRHLCGAGYQSFSRRASTGCR